MQRRPAALSEQQFDVVVVGGGICGAAIAWDAAQRGLSTALVERADFGGATSANSLKVVHGGIRYLQHLDVQRVRESSRERSALLRIAPHLVQPLPVVVPTFGHGVRGGEALAAAFLLLNTITGDRNRGLRDPARRIPPARLVSRRQMRDWFPEVDQAGLTGGGVFWDGQVYNPPRLVWEFIRTAGQAGAIACNYCEVRGFLRRGDRIEGVAVHDRLSGATFDVRGRVVVNAAGPFAEQLLIRAGLRPSRRVPLSRDLALVIRRPLVRERAVAVQTGYRDPDAWLSRGPRHLFIVPWRGATLVGVNSIVYPGDPFALATTEGEVDEFVGEIARAVPAWRLTSADVAAVHAGMLPIESSTLRRHNVSFGKRPYLVDNARTDAVEGLITAMGNRLTTARGVAQQAVNMVFRKLGTAPPSCRTRELPLHGGRIATIEGLMKNLATGAAGGLEVRVRESLARNHGSASGEVLKLVEGHPSGRPTLADSSTIGAQVIHAVREEMGQTLADIVFRRTELGTAGHPGEPALAACAGLAAGELGWSAARVESELSEVRGLLRAPLS